MEIKITSPKGLVIITGRDQESRFGGMIKHVSSTELQPYICANIDAQGNCIGGRTAQKSYIDMLLAKAKEAGWNIEEVANA